MGRVILVPALQVDKVLALTRDSSSAGARSLAAKSSSITIIQGDFDNVSVIFDATSGIDIWGVFSVQQGIGPGMSASKEKTQGKALVDAAITHGVKHFVYSSATRKTPPQPTRVPTFQAKHYLEEYLINATKDTEMAWTILRPAVFFENLTPDIVGLTFAAALKYIIAPDRPVQFIAVADIGRFAAQVFLNVGQYRLKTIDLAGDTMTFAENSRVFKKITGQALPLPYEWWILPWLVFKVFMSELGVMFEYFSDEGFDIDVEEVRKLNPQTMTYRDWLEQSSFCRKTI